MAGWDGDTKGTRRIVDGAIVGGSLDTRVPHNEFLATTREFGNFVLQVHGGGKVQVFYKDIRVRPLR